MALSWGWSSSAQRFQNYVCNGSAGVKNRVLEVQLVWVGGGLCGGWHSGMSKRRIKCPFIAFLLQIIPCHPRTGSREMVSRLWRQEEYEEYVPLPYTSVKLHVYVWKPGNTPYRAMLILFILKSYLLKLRNFIVISSFSRQTESDPTMIPYIQTSFFSCLKLAYFLINHFWEHGSKRF